ncbi:MAG: transaldolase, partial [Acidobacteria bacterium]|nr:transaldolase [Acidobacteriota bacterium]
MTADPVEWEDGAALPPALREATADAVDDWERGRGSARLWGRDASLWTGSGEDRWLGWLDAPGRVRADLDRLRSFGAAVSAEGLTHIGLLGMGGSSLCPEVLRETFGRVAGAPDLRVLDSTDPAQVRSFERELDVERTLFVVASKSGTTLEPNLFERYFFARAAERIGAEAAASGFVAITDPGSALDDRASTSGFRAVFRGEPSIGGR